MAKTENDSLLEQKTDIIAMHQQISHLSLENSLGATCMTKQLRGQISKEFVH